MADARLKSDELACYVLRCDRNRTTGGRADRPLVTDRERHPTRVHQAELAEDS